MPKRRPVSHPRSSNRTCGFPASGFPTGFTARLTNEGSIGHLEVAGLRIPKDHFIAEVARRRALPRKLVLRLAIQLALKFPELTRCCQTYRQSPLLPSFTSTPEVRALSSAGITRPHRSYGPLRLPDWPPSFLTTFGAATPSQSRASLTDLRSPSLHAVLNTPVDRIRCSLVGELRVPARVSSLSIQPSPISGRVGVHITTFEACSSFTRVTACRVAHPPYVGFIARLHPSRFPGSGARQLPSSTNNLLEWVLPPLVICAVEAHPISPSYDHNQAASQQWRLLGRLDRL
jgi:hypothetical protein